MPHPTYSAKLRDPRWQRKRLEIMKRDDFICQCCGDTEQTLNVHHCYYRRGAEPWDYESESLLTLCQDCHEVETSEGQNSRNFLIHNLAVRGATYDNFDAISDAIRASKLDIESLCALICSALAASE